MKITPLEIRQKAFEKKMRGYDKDEVNAFLLSLSQEWELVQDEVKELRIKHQNSVAEVKQLREVESSLYKTLKTAEDTGANLIDQATKTAELHLRETQMNADGLLNEAKTRARTVIEDAEVRARQIVEEAEDRMKQLSHDFKSLENLRDNLIAELSNLSNDTLARVSRMVQSSRSSSRTDIKYKTAVNNPEKPVAEKPMKDQQHNPAKEPVKQQNVDEEESSFFDEIN